MEFVNQIIAYLTPYFGEYARFAPIALGIVLALFALLIKRSVMKGMRSKEKVKDETSGVSAEGTTDHVDSHPEERTSLEEVEAVEESIAEPEIVEALADKVEEAPEEKASKQSPPEPAAQAAPEPVLSWSQRIKAGLARTRNGFGAGLSSIVMGSKKIDDDLLEELESQLLMADVGMEATQSLISTLTEKMNRKELKDGSAVLKTLKGELNDILVNTEQVLDPTKSDGPFVILMVGVNGVGKTTTIGKLAKKYQADGKSVMLAAGDTFRAAAVEQLQVWGERNNVPVVAQHTGADSASVIYDAIESAKARGVDVVIADTAGRLQNKANLMNELEKVVRVMKKLDVEAPHEVMLVLDAGTGQNALSQAKLFTEAVGVSGITLTKLDGTAKGGIIFAIAKQFGLPIRYIGVGEQVDDLRPFKSQEFVDALFDSE
ncbi:signal recognition particle-docking protein FtsY [Marinomonas piezotolerans]|uniref:Signal recognition particle receptor FtsY n=1 Tax=Marinomonas piezotolerans TaxID=2213058 RepID=A0A370UAI3_9GAMM|nr:signal recognition particle-docking protein FtsY [Marinomonas piezotolerans]RDL44807.1 signal recognition particle-docking protein FtsY [Marinomonas piezotolerans]